MRLKSVQRIEGCGRRDRLHLDGCGDTLGGQHASDTAHDGALDRTVGVLHGLRDSHLLLHAAGGGGVLCELLGQSGLLTGEALTLTLHDGPTEVGGGLLAGLAGLEP